MINHAIALGIGALIGTLGLGVIHEWRQPVQEPCLIPFSMKDGSTLRLEVPCRVIPPPQFIITEKIGKRKVMGVTFARKEFYDQIPKTGLRKP